MISLKSFIQSSFVGLFCASAVTPALGFELFTYNIKTGLIKQVTDTDGNEFNPSFSNNSKQVVHERIEADNTSALYIIDLDSGKTKKLENTEGGNDAKWSPNGKLIAFDTRNGGVDNIYVISSKGGTPTLVRESAIYPTWSQNNKMLAFMDVSDQSLRTVNLETGVETVVVTGGNIDLRGQPSWSPNGKAIAYFETNTDSVNYPNADIYTVAVNSEGNRVSDPVQLTNSQQYVNSQSPTWLNNSKSIVYHSNRNNIFGDFKLWMVPASGGPEALITDGANPPTNGPYDPDASKNGKLLIFAAQ